MEQPLKQTMVLFSLAESFCSVGNVKKKRRKKKGKKTTAAALLAGARDVVVRSRERSQHIYMSSLFRHTLENVTSFQARHGKGSRAEGEKSPDRG